VLPVYINQRYSMVIYPPIREYTDLKGRR